MKAQRDYLSLIAVARMYLFLQLFATPFLVSVFNNTEIAQIIESELIFPMAKNFTVESVAYSALGYVSFLCGTLIRVPQFRMCKFEIDWASPNIGKLFFGLFLIAYAIKLVRLSIGHWVFGGNPYYELFGNLAYFFFELSWLHLIGLAFLGISYYENRLIKSEVAWYYPFVLGFYLISGLLNGSFFAIVLPLSVHIAIRQQYHKIKIGNLIWMAALILTLMYFKMWMKTIISVGFDGAFSVYYPLTFVINRLSVSFVINALLENPGVNFGFGLAEQFLYVFKVPGFEYAAFDANYFGRHYFLISENDMNTSMAISVIGDLLLHGGVFGLSFGMLMIGAFYKFASSLASDCGNLFLLIYSMLWPIMIHGLESPVSILFGTVARIVLVCVFTYLLYFYLIKMLKNHGSPVSIKNN